VREVPGRWVVTTTVDVLRQVCGLIEYRSLPSPRIVSVNLAATSDVADFVALHLTEHGDVWRWADEFHANPHLSETKGVRSWSVDFIHDGLHLRVSSYEHHVPDVEHTAAVA
jgi:hypothetical protein